MIYPPFIQKSQVQSGCLAALSKVNRLMERSSSSASGTHQGPLRDTEAEPLLSNEGRKKKKSRKALKLLCGLLIAWLLWYIYNKRGDHHRTGSVASEAIREDHDNTKQQVFAQCSEDHHSTLLGELLSIQRQKKDELIDPEVAAHAVRMVGLTPSSSKASTKSLYGSDRFFALSANDASDDHSGPHLGVLLMPDQVGCAMAQLSRLNIQSFLEVGTGAGWTGLFLAQYLQQLSKGKRKFEAMSVDSGDFRTSCAKGLMDLWGHKFIMQDGSLTAPELSTPVVDLCFFNADLDSETIEDAVRRYDKTCNYIMLTGIVDMNTPGAVREWNTLKASELPSGAAHVGADLTAAPQSNPYTGQLPDISKDMAAPPLSAGRMWWECTQQPEEDLMSR